MSLKNKFKTNSEAANSGVWYDYTDQPNADGSVPGFKLARRGAQNKAYAKAMREHTAQYVGEDGNADLSSLSEEDADAVETSVFIDGLLLDWRNFQPEDDGNDLAFAKDTARDIFGNPDWFDLRADLIKRCGKSDMFREAVLKAEAKN